MTMQRVRTINQGLVSVSAAAAWEFLTDWAATRRRRLTAEGQLAYTALTLEGGENDIPRTRVIEMPALGTVRETLLHQDDAAMHLYYNIEGELAGIRNYLATTDVDDLGPHLCQVTVTARFDLPQGADVAAAKAMIDLAHNQHVIGALRRYFAPDSLSA